MAEREQVAALDERWLRVPGHDMYEVSDQGRVRSLHGRYSGVKILRQNLASRGYPSVGLSPGRQTVKVAHLVLSAFIGPRLPGQVVRHLDGDKTNSRLTNLAYGTPAENEADKRRHGTSPQGERHGSARLTETNVRAIRSAFAAGAAKRTLAREFGVSQRAIQKIIHGTTWSHVA